LNPEARVGANVNRAFASGPVKKAKKNTTVILTFAAIIGLIGIGAARMMTAPKPAETVRIVAAAKDLPPGCKISFASMHYLDMPAKYYDANMFSSYEQLIGKTTRTFIPAREPLTKHTVSLSAHGLPSELPKGLRGITLKLTEDGTVDQQVRPGDRVDVVATTNYKSKNYTKTICQNLLVMMSTPKEVMLSDTLRSQENNKVTLAVNPAEAEILSEAQEDSKLRLVMRSWGDMTRAEVQGSDIRDLLPHDALREEPPQIASPTAAVTPLPPPPAPDANAPAFADLPPPVAEPLRWAVQMFSGTKKEVLEIETSK
jgi:Flp pilus assembly protein CpaB